MKSLLTTILCLCSCSGPKTLDASLADGSVIHYFQLGHFGGKDYTHFGKSKGWQFTSRTDMEKSFNDGVIAAGTYGIGYQYELTKRAESAGEVAVINGAQKLELGKAKIAADLEKAKIPPVIQP